MACWQSSHRRPIKNLWFDNGSRKAQTESKILQLAPCSTLFAIHDNGRNHHEEDDGYEDDELWIEEPMDDELMLDGPEAFLNDDDLFLLHDIPNLPSDVHTNPSSNSTGNNDAGSPQVISLQDLQDLKQLSVALPYFYLRDELGFSADAMWKITNEAGSALYIKTPVIREKIEVLRNTMQLSDDDIQDLITAQPTLLQLSARRNLSPTILFLLRQLDLARDELRRLVLGCPALLAYSIPNLKQKIRFFTITMGYSVADCRRVLLEEPKLLTCSVETGLIPRFLFLEQELEIPMQDLRKIIKKNPRILTMSVDNNLQPKLIFYFIMTLYMRPAEVRKLLLNYPKILNYNLEEHIKPITRYFLSLDFSALEFARMLQKFPRLVTYSLYKIKHIVGYLRFELGLDAHEARRVLYHAPQVVSLTTTNLQTKVDFLFEVVSPTDRTWEDESSTAILQKVVAGMPTLLYLSIENNLSPKVEYLKSTLGSEALSEALARQPTLLAYSLDKRIKPRLEKILEAGVDGGSLTVGITMNEKSFGEWLQRRAEKAKVGLPKGKTRVVRVNEEEEDEAIEEIRLEAEDRGNDGSGGKGNEEKRVVENGGRIVHWVRRST